MNWLQDMRNAGWSVDLWSTPDGCWCLRLRREDAVLNAERETLSETLALAAVEFRAWARRRAA